MFSIPNPKKTLSINQPIDLIKKSIPKIYVASNGKYKIHNINEMMNQITLECMEGLSLGVYIDFDLSILSEQSTNLTIEIRRKVGSFDNPYEIDNANWHIEKLTTYLSDIVPMSDEEFNFKYQKEIRQVNEVEQDASKPWYAKKYIANIWIILGLSTLIFGIGLLVLPIGIYAKIMKYRFESNQ
jgi:hypothetical protein